MEAAAAALAALCAAVNAGDVSGVGPCGLALVDAHGGDSSCLIRWLLVRTRVLPPAQWHGALAVVAWALKHATAPCTTEVVAEVVETVTLLAPWVAHGVLVPFDTIRVRVLTAAATHSPTKLRAELTPDSFARVLDAAEAAAASYGLSRHAVGACVVATAHARAVRRLVELLWRRVDLGVPPDLQLRVQANTTSVHGRCDLAVQVCFNLLEDSGLIGCPHRTITLLMELARDVRGASTSISTHARMLLQDIKGFLETPRGQTRTRPRGVNPAAVRVCERIVELLHALPPTRCNLAVDWCESNAHAAQFSLLPLLRMEPAEFSDAAAVHILGFLRKLCRVPHGVVYRLRDAAVDVLRRRPRSCDIARAAVSLLRDAACVRVPEAFDVARPRASIRAFAPALERAACTAYECEQAGCAGFCVHAIALEALAQVLHSHPPDRRGRSALLCCAARVEAAAGASLRDLLVSAADGEYATFSKHAKWKMRATLRAAYAALTHTARAEDATVLDAWCEAAMAATRLDMYTVPFAADLCALNNDSTVGQWSRWCGGFRREWMRCSIAASQAAPQAQPRARQDGITEETQVLGSLWSLLQDPRLRPVDGFRVQDGVVGAVTRMLD
jgi:hypothetical protein